jgi:hypothetical protein
MGNKMLVDAMMAELGLRSNEATAWENKAWKWSKDLVNSSWEKIQIAAESLIQSRKLSKNEVLEICA